MSRDLPADDNPSMDDILECLNRSGYMLESRLVRLLTEEGFFVEANQVAQDARTGKSREIDLIAEFYRHTPEHRYSCVKTTLVVEAVNNKYPFVLLTPWAWTPLSSSDYRVKFGVSPHPGAFLSKFDLDEDKNALID